MIIPYDFPDDLLDYIYTFILYKQNDELLNDIINFSNIKNKLFDNYKKKNGNNVDNYITSITKNIINLMHNNDNLIINIPKPILKNYNDIKYHIINQKLLVNLFIVKNLNKNWIIYFIQR